MSVYFCKKCGTHENIRFTVELIPESEDTPDDVWSVRLNAVCSGCGDWISVDATSAMADFFEYFGPKRDEDTLILDDQDAHADELRGEGGFGSSGRLYSEAVGVLESFGLDGEEADRLRKMGREAFGE